MKIKKKKIKKHVPTGIAHIKSTFNNTIVSITDLEGSVVSWYSTGMAGFKGAKKGTPYAAQLAAELAGKLTKLNANITVRKRATLRINKCYVLNAQSGYN